MNPYTVILLRPDYMTDNFGQDTYTAHVRASGTRTALEKAQREAFRVDHKDGAAPRGLDDYALVVILEGHPEVLVYGGCL